MGLIYCATNKVNGKKYIGLTVRGLENRKRRHKECLSKGGKVKWKFQRALVKYGWENFKWGVLEDGIEYFDDLCLKEKYYIEKYNTFYEGYNMTKGGDGVGEGDSNPNTKYPDSLVKEIIEYIINTEMTQKNIAETLGVPRSLVKDVAEKKYRVGCWGGRDNPRVKQVVKRTKKEDVKRIIKHLEEGKISQKEISKVVGVSGNVVSGIARGINYKEMWDYNSYRNKRDKNQFTSRGDNHHKAKYDEDSVLKMKEYMLKNKFKTKEVSEIFGFSSGYIGDFIRRKVRKNLTTAEEIEAIKLNRVVGGNKPDKQN